MTHDITSSAVVPFPVDVRATIRGRVRETIEEVLQEELEAVLGAAPRERTEQRAGYRNGSIERRVLTEHGPHELTIPRGRVHAPDGSSTE